MVDKNFEVVDNFHGHIRTQQGRLPWKPSQIYQFDDFRKTLCLSVICSAKNGFGRKPKASRISEDRSIGTWLNLTKGRVHNVTDEFGLN